MNIQEFVKWEDTAFGYGYGSGEGPVLDAVKVFLDNCWGHSFATAYEHGKLEATLGAATTWLLINRFCQTGIIEYGSSPRYGWLTSKGVSLRTFVATHSTDELIEMIFSDLS